MEGSNRVFVVPENITLNECIICTFSNIKSEAAQYLVQPSPLKILEVQELQANGNYSSWFCGQNVIKDGSLYMATVVDPLFLFLSLFDKYANKTYRNLQDIITEDKNEDLRHLREAEQFVDFNEICDVQVIIDVNYWKINEQKVLVWLGKKFETLKEKLSSLKYSETSEISSFVPVQSEKDEEVKYVKATIGFLSEYISPEWLQKLKVSKGIIEEQLEDEKRSYTTMEDVYKYSHQRPTTDPNSFAFGATTKKPAKQTKAAKIDKRGMGSLKSFFGSPPKK